MHPRAGLEATAPVLSEGGQTLNGRLEGKRALITGIGGGQGEAALQRFCQEGARVVGCDIKPGLAEAAAERIRSMGFYAQGRTVDLADPQQASQWVERAAEDLGGIDLLYNNASRPVFSPFAEMTLADWRETIRNELDIIFHVTSPAWKHLAASGRASVINTASISALRGVGPSGQVAHAAAKGGVIALTTSLAAEGAPLGIRVNAISPGFVASPGTEALTPPPMWDLLINKVQMIHRPARPAEVAGLAVYLASDEASFVTGVNIRFDGGWGAGLASSEPSPAKGSPG